MAGCPVNHMEEPALSEEAKDFEAENLTDFMDFSITDVAEQLTHMDTVSASVSLLPHGHVDSHVVMLVFVSL